MTNPVLSHYLGPGQVLIRLTFRSSNVLHLQNKNFRQLEAIYIMEFGDISKFVIHHHRSNKGKSDLETISFITFDRHECTM